MAKPDKGIGILIGVGPKKPSSDGDDEYAGDEPESKGHSEVQLAAAEALMSAIEAKDAEAFCEAMDAYLGG